MICRGDFARYARKEKRRNKGQTSGNREHDQAPEQMESQHGDMRVINIIHRVRGTTKEFKEESRDRLREIGKIKKMRKGDVFQ